MKINFYFLSDSFLQSHANQTSNKYMNQTLPVEKNKIKQKQTTTNLRVVAMTHWKER